MVQLLAGLSCVKAQPTGKKQSGRAGKRPRHAAPLPLFRKGQTDMKAVLIPGDGIGREIAQSVRKISDVLATGIEWEEYAAGAEYAAEHGELLQPGALDAIEEYGWALKGPTATPYRQRVPQHQRAAAPAL